VPRISTTYGQSFDTGEGESILDAALRAGLTLPYSCRTGRCSTCKCRVNAGSTIELHEELGLSPEERAGGWILGCVRSAIGDVTLDVEDLGSVRLATPRTHPCRIQSIERAATDVMRIRLRLPPTVAFEYTAGQYIDVIGEGGLRRSYSIANAWSAERLIELHVREVDAGVMSAYWFGQARVNDLLRLHGPLGTFFLRDVAGHDLVFLATGTGIAPFKAMLEALAALEAEQRPRSISLYWGGRKPADLYWSPEQASVAHRYVPVLSRADDTWQGARGHVQRVLLEDKPDLARCLVYACGSDTMIHSARAVLLKAGLPERHFYSDAFVCSAAV
jgi:CDP-4-dehydro-6-deoxyglucose reductase